VVLLLFSRDDDDDDAIIIPFQLQGYLPPLVAVVVFHDINKNIGYGSVFGSIPEKY
jgi:hypothetical protein